MSHDDTYRYKHRLAVIESTLLDDESLSLDPLASCRQDYWQTDAARRLARLFETDP